MAAFLTKAEQTADYTLDRTELSKHKRKLKFNGLR